LESAYPDANRAWNAVAVTPLQDFMVQGSRTALLLLLGAVAFALLIACANIASLLLARASARAREMAVRTALGAGRGRLVRQLLTESVLLAALGGVAGLIVAAAASDAFLTLATDRLPRAAEVHVDLRVLWFALGISLISGILFGTAPALRASGLDLVSGLNEGGRGNTGGRRHRLLHHGLVVVETALAVTLALGAGLLLRSLQKMHDVDVGFDPAPILAVGFAFPGYRYDDSESYQRQYDRILEAVRGIPGVINAGGVQQMPGTGLNESVGFEVPGREPPSDEEGWSALIRTVSPGYIETMGIPVLQGRTVRAADDATAPLVVMINRTLAEQVWPGESAVGRRIDAWSAGPAEVIGVVGDVRHGGLTEEPRPTIYVPNVQVSRSRVVMMVRGTGDPRTLADPVRRAIWSVDPDQPIRLMAPLEEVIGDTVAGPRFASTLLAGFAGLAILMAALGIYGVLGYAVTQRSHELGVRMTLGARRHDILRLVLEEGAILAGAGISAGLLTFLAFSRLLKGMLFEVTSADPYTVGAVVVTALSIAMAACYVPARRATGVDPLDSLRSG
jgi:putative ABC transport system permease protein